MKKFKLLFLIIFMFGFLPNVMAEDTVTYEDVEYKTEDITNYFNSLCDTKAINTGSIVSIGNSNKCIGSSIETKIRDEKGECTDDSCGQEEEKPVAYNIIFLVDMSNSMRKGASKIGNVNTALKEAVKVIQGENKKNKKYKVKHDFTICTFGSGEAGEGKGTRCYEKNKLKVFKDGKNGDARFNTYTMAGFDLISTKLSSSKKAPLIMLVTDGYPTYAKSGSRLKMTNLAAPRYFYYTLNKIKSVVSNLKAKNKYTKYYTFGAFPNGKNDPVVNFFLNPTAETYNNLGDTSYHGSNLGVAIKDIYENNKVVYDAVAGVYANPDKLGSIYGKVNVSKKTVIFDIPSGMKKKKLRFFMPTSSKPSKIYVCKDTSCSKEKRSIIKCKVEHNDSSPRDGYSFCDLYTKEYVRFKFMFKSANFDKKIDVSNSKVNASSYYNMVEKSFFESGADFKDDFKTALNEAFKLVDTVENSVISSRLYSGACYRNSNYSYPVNKLNNGNYYAKYSVSATKITEKDNGEVSSEPYSSSGCIGISNLSFPILVYNNVKFGFDNKMFGKTIYAGGGYAFPTFNVNNDIHGVYGRFKAGGNGVDDNSFMFNAVELNITNPNGKTIDTISDVYLDSSTVYTDNECKNAVGNTNNVNSMIQKYINDNINTIGSQIFKTVDANDENVISYFSMIEDTNSTKSSTKLVHPNAYINIRTGNIVYEDKKKDENNYVFGSNLQYVPLKYKNKTADISLNGNVSKFNKINVNVYGKCLVNVKQLLYDCPNDVCPDKMEVSYKYRSIDHNNPFPKGGLNNEYVALNWKSWIKNSENKSRLSKTYDSSKLNYIFEGVRERYNTSYLSWAGIDKFGKSEFVDKNFSKTGTSVPTHCPLGSSVKYGTNNSCLDG